MAKMKRSEIILWVMVALALAANIWLPKHLHQKYSWDRDLSQRLAADFCRSREEVKDYIRKYDPYVTDGQIDEWTESGKLESMVIGKNTVYFRNAAPNLFRIDPEMKAKKDFIERNNPSKLSGHQAVDSAIIPAIKEAVTSKPEDGFLAMPKRMRVRFSLTVPVNTLRAGKTLRCWLPYPRSDVPRQTDIKFIEAGVDSTAYPAEKIVFSDPSCAHSSLYMEAKTNRYRDVTFYEVFEYTSCGEWHPVDPDLVLKYDTSTEEYKEYTSEREKHIIFTDRIKSMADSLTEGIENPYLQAKAIYTWINDNIPWASAREYSTIDNIPEYVLTTGHGDCGQKTLLFMSMCRYKGIPVRWQSGLMTHPGNENLHDWCEIHFEGYGWMPVDQSFGITPYGGYFYMGGIEPYRLVVNSDFGREFSPARKFPRSDDVDFQRGEVEWDGGNLYYNQWNYGIEIEYL